jgi:hypothetical protein
MISYRDLRKRIGGITLSVIVLIAVASNSVSAAEPHEDPETAKQVFSGISLFRHYSDALDHILRKIPIEVETRLVKMPFANIPQSLEEVTQRFASSSISVSRSVIAIDDDLDTLRMLMEQFRLKEAIKLAITTSARLSQANSDLHQIEQAIEITGLEFKISSAQKRSMLKQSYDDVVDRIDRIGEMLERYENLLEDVLQIEEIKELLDLVDVPLEKLLESTDTTLEKLLEWIGITLLEPLRFTHITLEIEPTVAFVGDNIRFSGMLTSDERPLAGREIDILLNNSQYITVMTDANGYYEGTLQLPYWYVPEIDLQALYYPRDDEIGLYLASLSPVITVEVLFYTAMLEVNVEDKAYPGLDTTLEARFDYDKSPLLSKREVEIYLDDALVTRFIAQQEFAQQIEIAPQVNVGEHVITVSSSAIGRYSPVIASVVLEVTRATPIINLNIPKLALVPGSVGLEGKLYSEVGPLSGALVTMDLGDSQIEFVSSDDGTLDTEISVGMGLGLIGSQDLTIHVIPQEPWHSSLHTTSSVFMVNVVNCGAFVIVLFFLSIYLPRRLRRRLSVHAVRTSRSAEAQTLPELATTHIERITTFASIDENEEARLAPQDKILYWYHFILRLLRGITRVLLEPQQTLREFAKETGIIIGPAAKYLVELTRIIERLLYSQYKPTEEDADHSRLLSQKIQEETKLIINTQLSLARQLHGEGWEVPSESSEISVDSASTIQHSGRVLITNPWRQLSTWIWVLLILAVAFYAYILLFLLPWLVAPSATCLPLVTADCFKRKRGV